MYNVRKAMEGRGFKNKSEAKIKFQDITTTPEFKAKHKAMTAAMESKKDEKTPRSKEIADKKSRTRASNAAIRSRENAEMYKRMGR